MNIPSITLSSWNEGESKQRIIDFLHQVTDEKSSNFVPQKDRIAVFDFDGTIGCEKPDYMEVIVAMKQLCLRAEKDPSLFDKNPIYKAACTGNYEYIDKHVYPAILEAFLNYDQDVYIDSVKSITSTYKHPKFHQPYSKLYYVPMVELINLLKEQEFSVYIVSGSEEGFLRAYGENYLDFQSEKIIGSTVALKYDDSTGSKVKFLRDSAYFKPMAYDSGKAVLIKNRIGKAPILAFGNTMGDYEMLTYTKSNEHLSLELILIHDDPSEYIYHDTILEAKAKLNDWVSVKMKNDFKKVFEFDK